MSVKSIFYLWFPLALSFELMMLEGPSVQAAMGRLPQAQINLAAWGLTMSLSLLVESPIIMLLATAIALVKNADTFHALRRFMLELIAFCTALTFLVAYTPLFDFVAGRLMGQPRAIVEAARPAMRIMLFWTAAIGWRRFYQGMLVGHGHTRMVTFGTVFRLVATVVVAVSLTRMGSVPGVQVGAWALMVAVVTEAIATTLFARPVLRDDVFPIADTGVEPLTQRAILKFHAPLAATTLLTLLAMPMASAALARLPNAEITLAAAPVAFMLLLVMRGWAFALQEITVAQSRDPKARPVLARFSILVGLVTSAVTAVIAFTPFLELYLGAVIHSPTGLWSHVRIAVGIGCLLPLITALGSWARGLLVAAGNTKAVYRGMAINLATHGILLYSGVLLHLPGMWVAAGSFTVAAIVEFGYLYRRVLEVGPLFESHAKGKQPNPIEAEVAQEEALCAAEGR